MDKLETSIQKQSPRLIAAKGYWEILGVVASLCPEGLRCLVNFVDNCVTLVVGVECGVALGGSI